MNSTASKTVFPLQRMKLVRETLKGELTWSWKTLWREVRSRHRFKIYLHTKNLDSNIYP
jgi:hypothetical protein